MLPRPTSFPLLRRNNFSSCGVQQRSLLSGAARFSLDIRTSFSLVACNKELFLLLSEQVFFQLIATTLASRFGVSVHPAAKPISFRSIYHGGPNRFKKCGSKTRRPRPAAPTPSRLKILCCFASLKYFLGSRSRQDTAHSTQRAAGSGHQTAGSRQQAAHSTQHTAHSTQHTAHSTRHTAHSTQHTAHSTQHTAHSTQHAAHGTLHTAHSTQHAAHSTQHTAHSTQHTARSTQHTAHSTQHTAHSTQRTARSTQHAARSAHETADSRQQTAGSGQHTADSRQQAAGSRQQHATHSTQQEAGSKNSTIILQTQTQTQTRPPSPAALALAAPSIAGTKKHGGLRLGRGQLPVPFCLEIGPAGGIASRIS
jgi:hypothetical protein